MAHKPDVKTLHEDQNFAGLIDALRFPGSPEVRAEAALALGAMNRFEAVESLVYARRHDPDLTVQKAALSALHELLGNTAEMVIATYGPFPEDEPWIIDLPIQDEEHKEADTQPDNGGPHWEREDIAALMAILRTEGNPSIRVKAIRALSQIDSTEAIDALAMVALWEDEDASREAAHAALEEIYGDDLPEVLQSYRDAEEEEDSRDQESEDALEGEGELAKDRGEDSTGRWARVPAFQATPVIQEEKAGWTTALLVGLLLLVALAIVVYLLTR